MNDFTETDTRQMEVVLINDSRKAPENQINNTTNSTKHGSDQDIPPKSASKSKMCSVIGCRNKDKHVTLYPFPNATDKRYSMWVYLAGIKKPKRGGEYICSIHFEKDEYVPNTSELKDNAIPTVELPEYQDPPVTHMSHEDIIVNPSNITTKLCNAFTAYKNFKLLCEHNLKEFSTLFFIQHPNAYRILEKNFQLLPPSEIKQYLRNNHLNFDKSTHLFGQKLKHMSEKERTCFITLSPIKIEPNVFYDVQSDMLVGWYSNSQGVIKKSISANILIAHGIYNNWHLPIDYNFVHLAEQNKKFRTNWFELVIKQLTYIGLKIKAFIWSPCYISNVPKSKILGYSAHDCYITYDLQLLLRLLVYNGLVNNSTLLNHPHLKLSAMLKNFYYEDKARQYPLAPNLTIEHIEPNSLDEFTFQHLKEFLSPETLSLLRMHCQQENELKCLHNIETLADMINFFESDIENNEKMQKLYDMHQFLKDLDDGYGVKDDLILTFSWYIHVFKENPDMFARMSKLMLNNYSHKFVNSLLKRCDGDHPTSKGVQTAYRRSFIENILKPFGRNDYSLENALDIAQKHFNPEKLHKKLNFMLKVNPSECKVYMLERKDKLLYLAGYMMKRLLSYHEECKKFVDYLSIKDFEKEQCASLSESILQDIKEEKCLMLKSDFIDFVEMLEIGFLCVCSKFIMRKNLIQKLMESAEIQSVVFRPCACFPLSYAKELFIITMKEFLLNIHHLFQH